MDIQQAEKRTRELAEELFGMSFSSPVLENSRLTRTLGRYKFRRMSKKHILPLKIEYSSRLLNNYNDETIESVIKHELTHWALSVKGLPFDDGDPEFESELRRVGAHSTGVITLSGTIHTAKCSKCDKIVSRNNSEGCLWKYVKPNSRYTTRCCKARIVLGDVIYQEDTNTVAASPKVKPVIPQQIPNKQVAIQSSTQTLTRQNVNLNDVLEKGPRGVTNKQMIPAIRKVLDMENKSLLITLEESYPEVFNATIRYIGKSYQAKLISMKNRI